MLEKKVIIDSINVLEDGHIQIREVTRILENGEKLSESYKRWVISPGADTTNQTDKVKNIANVVHTQDVIDTYKAKK